MSPPRRTSRRALLERVREARQSRRPASSADEGTSRALPELVLKDVHLAFERHGRVEWGPLAARVRVEDTGNAQRLEATARLPGGGSAELSLQRTEAGPSGTLRARDVPAGPLLSLVEPPCRLEGGMLEGEVRAS